ncbi:hypothetical protein KL930_002311 [Ogataea haglerorum]|uniref:60S ribosomal protein L44 n=1 Tax=Ogataea haglerorum TaxID=1937702 RepID=A0AAN6I196_9ASCO|nr:uncharacterized protein KL911_000083 [Ogataea haglerorum]KAG7698901.1 hypothetical protein KL915_001193 [Ogataea haglerorum]KAG7700505.1 hypothetical protein KL951_000620 [Ogataea haglerorum]KAG7709943.1 hypothetical protein KL914_000853 [Ogataea haglerorum]KAG7711276.1 hypothetical protein KL950_001242 [Ogataea haglerorum]KAG7720573.1 hypothetical protein KL913_001473 [Ogataea haglerorum]
MNLLHINEVIITLDGGILRVKNIKTFLQGLSQISKWVCTNRNRRRTEPVSSARRRQRPPPPLTSVNVPKTRKTYCKGKNCRKHTQHRVTQYKAGKASLYAQGKRRYDRKQSGYGGQTKQVFHKKAKTTKKVVLRLECVSCKTKLQLPLKRCKHFELGGDKKQKGQALQF